MTEVYVGNIWKGGRQVVGILDYNTLRVKSITPFEVMVLNEPSRNEAYDTTGQLISLSFQDDFKTKINGVPVYYHDMHLRVGKYCYELGFGSITQYVLNHDRDWNKFTSDSSKADKSSLKSVQFFDSKKSLMIYFFYYATHESNCFIVRGVGIGVVDDKTVTYGFILKLSETGELLGTYHTDSSHKAIGNAIQYDESLSKYYLMQNY